MSAKWKIWQVLAEWLLGAGTSQPAVRPANQKNLPEIYLEQTFFGPNF